MVSCDMNTLCASVPFCSPNGQHADQGFSRVIRRARLGRGRLQSLASVKSIIGVNRGFCSCIPSQVKLRCRNERGRQVLFLRSASSSENLQPAAPSTAGASRGLMAAFTVERLGEQAWLFATPFLLLSFHASSSSLVGPALYGVSRMCAQTLVGPWLGGWMDNSRRLHVLLAAASVQVVSITAAVGVCFLFGTQAEVVSSSQQAMFGVFACVCGLGVLDALGKMLASVAISRDWVPALYGTEAEPLSRVNSQLARLDLAAEVVGPIGAGVLFGLLSEKVYPSLFVLGLLRILCLVAQTAFFINILQRYPALDWRAGLEPASKQRDSPNILTAWRTFLQHPGRVQLIVFSYAMVYLTVLSPHGLLLTAYLSTESLSASVLSVFRGCGALVGIVGVTVFQLAVKACGLPKATLGFIGFQALCSILAAAVFQLSHGQHLALHAFMFLVVLARFGLYGFEVGALQLQQMTVKEECRGAFGTVEKSLCASASLLMYVGSAIASQSGSGQFWIMVWGSAMAVSTAAFISLTWLRSNAVGSTSPRSGDYQKENLGST